MSATQVMRAIWAVMLSLVMLNCAGSEPAAPPEPPEDSLADYRPVAAMAGALSSVGSDTLNSMVTMWAEDFRKLYPDVTFGVEGKGSSTAIPALIEGAAQLGPMSREPKPAEQEKFEKAFGYKATVLAVAMDAMAVYVHKENPLDEITLEQLDALYSTGRKRGYKEDIRTWNQLGLKGDWADHPISLYGRNLSSGIHGFCKEVALKGGDFKDTIREMMGSASVVQAVSEDRFGIGYSGIGHGVSHVKRLRIAEREGGKFEPAELETVCNGTYPFRRFLYVAINKSPGKPLSPLIKEFCAFIYSRQGQELIVKDGYYPVTASIAKEQLKKLGVEK